MRGSASPKGEARRVRAGKAEQSDRRAREDYGWGWAGRFNQTSPHNQSNTPPPNTRGSTSRTAPPAPHHIRVSVSGSVSASERACERAPTFPRNELFQFGVASTPA